MQLVGGSSGPAVVVHTSEQTLLAHFGVGGGVGGEGVVLAVCVTDV